MLGSFGSRMLLLLAVISSGAASLVYQVVWTRRLMSVTHATAEAQGLVLAIFMAGLGLGSWLSGRWVSRSRRPLVGYAIVECAAALFAVASLPLIIHSEGLRTGLTSWGMSASTALWMQLACVSFFLLIPTLLLGMSLPMVLGFAERQMSSASRSQRGLMLGLLYGSNTFGAALGCLIGGYFTIEYWGLTRSLWAGGCLALFAVLLASVLQWNAAGDEANTDGEANTGDEAPLVDELVSGSGQVGTIERSFLWVAAISGGVGLAAEVLWTRMVALIVFNTVYSFTQVLAAVLMGIALGGYLSSSLAHWGRGRADLRGFLFRCIAGLQLLAALWLAVLPMGMLVLARHPKFFVALAHGDSIWSLLSLFSVLVPPSAFIAATLPLLVMASRNTNGARTLGTLYASNSLGSVLGSFFAGFVLLPWLGMSWSLTLIACLALLVAVVCVQVADLGWRWLGGIVVVAMACFLLHFGAQVPQDIYAARIPKNWKLLDFREGTTSDVMVTEDPGGIRYLWINSSWVASTGGEHHLLGHLPALLSAQPRLALGIALGTGQTFSAVMRHPFKHMDCVDLNKEVIRMAKKWFNKVNRGLFQDPRVQVHLGDGRAFVRATNKRYDLIVLEPLQAWTAGTTGLYTSEFYKEARRALSKGGVLAQWIPFYGQGVRETKAMVKAALSAFPHATLWFYKRDGILLLQKQPVKMPLQQLTKRVRRMGLFKDLKRGYVQNIPDLMSLFLMGSDGLARWVKDAPLLADDTPFLEFAAARQIGAMMFVPIIRSALPHLESPIPYTKLDDPKQKALLQAATKVRGVLMKIASEQDASFVRRASLYEEGIRKTPDSGLIRGRYREMVMRWAKAALTPLRQTKVYQRALRHDPGFGRGVINLTIALARQGRFVEALAEVRKLSAPAGSILHQRGQLLARMLSARIPKKAQLSSRPAARGPKAPRVPGKPTTLPIPQKKPTSLPASR